MRFGHMKSKRKKILVNILLVFVLLSLAGLLAVLWVAQRDPGYFEDYGGEPAEAVIAASNECTEKILDLQLNYKMARRIDITEDEINGYIRYGFDSLAEYVPRDFASPQVRFRDGKIILSARYVGGKIPFAPVLSVVAELVNMEAGRMGCRIRTVNLGSLPIPAASMAKLVEKLESKAIDLKGKVKEVSRKAAEERDLSDEQIRDLEKLGVLAEKAEKTILSKKEKLKDTEKAGELARKALRKINAKTFRLKGGYTIKVGDKAISFIPAPRKFLGQLKGPKH